MVPPKTAQYLFDNGANDRERAIEKTRRDRALSAHPPRPHLAPCACDECRQWAVAIVARVEAPK